MLTSNTVLLLSKISPRNVKKIRKTNTSFFFIFIFTTFFKIYISIISSTSITRSSLYFISFTFTSTSSIYSFSQYYTFMQVFLPFPLCLLLTPTYSPIRVVISTIHTKLLVPLQLQRQLNLIQREQNKKNQNKKRIINIRSFSIITHVLYRRQNCNALDTRAKIPAQKDTYALKLIHIHRYTPITYYYNIHTHARKLYILSSMSVIHTIIQLCKHC